MTISINITLPPLESVPPAPAQSYLIAARHLYAGMEALSLEPGKTGIACAFLAAQSLECGLKSYLSHVGITEDKLKAQQIRHNLKALWAEAVQHGLNAQAQPPQWCVILNSAHDSHHDEAEPDSYQSRNGASYLTQLTTNRITFVIPWGLIWLPCRRLFLWHRNSRTFLPLSKSLFERNYCDVSKYCGVCV